jgi:hypothetical protein
MNAAPLTAYQFELAASIWPKSAFATENDWRDYVSKWFPKLKSLNEILAKK